MHQGRIVVNASGRFNPRGQTLESGSLGGSSATLRMLTDISSADRKRVRSQLGDIVNNQTWALLAAMAFNLLSRAQRLTLTGPYQTATPKTIRLRFGQQ